MLFEQFQDFSKFTNSEKQIIEYLLKNIHKIESMTISSLAENTYTSVATINRFCHHVNNSGFKEFKIQLIKELSSTHPASINANKPFMTNDNIYTASRKLSKLLQDTIEQTQLSLNYEQVNKAVETIANSKRIFMFARGDSYTRAKTFQHQLIKIDKYIILGDQNHGGSYNARNITKDDCAIFLTYSASHALFDSFIETLKLNQVPCILITASPNTPLAKQCDIKIIIPQTETIDAKVSNFSSQIAFEFVLDTLYSGLFITDYETNFEHKQLKESIVYNTMTKIS